MTNTFPMKPEDVNEVVRIHLISFQGFFLCFLGNRFLSVFYRCLPQEESGISLIYEEYRLIKGFVVGSTSPSGFYKNLIRKHIFQFAWASIGAFFRNPSILPRLLRAFSMPKQELPAENCATLMSIAVDPAYQNEHIGRQLVNSFLIEAKSRGSEFVNLATDAVDNDGVNHFYRSVGFELFRTFFTPEGREMNEYLFDLRSLNVD